MSTMFGAVASLGMAMASAGFTRYVYSLSRRASALRFGIITTTGFTISAGLYALGGDQNELRGAMIGSGTAALLAGMTTASAIRTKHPIPGIMAMLSVGTIIVHFKNLETLGLREKARREQELQNIPVQAPASASISAIPSLHQPQNPTTEKNKESP